MICHLLIPENFKIIEQIKISKLTRETCQDNSRNKSHCQMMAVCYIFYFLKKIKNILLLLLLLLLKENISQHVAHLFSQITFSFSFTSI